MTDKDPESTEEKKKESDFVKLLGMKGHCTIHPHPSLRRDERGNVLNTKYCYFPNEEIIMYFDYENRLRTVQGPSFRHLLIFKDLINKQFDDISELDF